MTRRQIFLYWSACGFVGGAIFIPLRNVLDNILFDFGDIVVPTSILPKGDLRGLVFGIPLLFIQLLPSLAIAFGQWRFVLRHYSISAWWVAASAAGRLGFFLSHFSLWFIYERAGSAAEFDLDGVVTLALFAAFGGLIFGALQYIFLITAFWGALIYISATIAGSILGFWYLLFLQWQSKPIFGLYANNIINTHSLPALMQAIVLAYFMKHISKGEQN